METETLVAEIPVRFGALWKAGWKSVRGRLWRSLFVIFIPGILSNVLSIGVGLALRYLEAAGMSHSVSGWINFICGMMINLAFWPMAIGISNFFLKRAKGEDARFSCIFEPYHMFDHYVWVYLRMSIFIFLWTLLFIIPGIIAGFRYSQTVFIALEKPELSAKDAMTESCRLMKGYKGTFFGYGILWCLIVFFGSLFTLGIGVIWLFPISAGFFANFYLAVKAAKAEKTVPAAEVQ